MTRTQGETVSKFILTDWKKPRSSKKKGRPLTPSKKCLCKSFGKYSCCIESTYIRLSRYVCLSSFVVFCRPSYRLFSLHIVHRNLLKSSPRRVTHTLRLPQQSLPRVLVVLYLPAHSSMSTSYLSGHPLADRPLDPYRPVLVRHGTYTRLFSSIMKWLSHSEEFMSTIHPF